MTCTAGKFTLIYRSLHIDSLPPTRHSASVPFSVRLIENCLTELEGDHKNKVRWGYKRLAALLLLDRNIGPYNRSNYIQPASVSLHYFIT